MKLTKWQIGQLSVVELQDDFTNQGGISFEGETLEHFLAETELTHLLEKEGGIDEINRALIQSGIKPVYPPLESVKVQVYYSNMDEDLSAIPFFTKEEILSEAKSHKGEEFDSIEDAISYLEKEAEWNPIYSTTQVFTHKNFI